MEYKKVNESYYAIQGSKEEHLNIYNFLKAERSNAKYDRMVQRGFRSRYTYFTRKIINNGQETLIVYYGHVQLLHNAKFNILPENNATAYTKDEILDFISQYKSILPFEPYDYQINGIVNGLTNFKLIQQLCTSSGKSLIISMIIEFFRIHNKKGLLIVPNINLLTQFKNDIKSYNLIDLYNEVDILGNGKKSDFTKALTICTWQSLQKIRKDLKDINPDYIICDEVHRMSSDVTSDILLQSINTKIKLGFHWNFAG
jgi:DNA or RNA helicases of superfamily II